jgi:hypothetical protein
MARRALAAAEKQLLPGSCVSSGPGVIGGQIMRVYPGGQRLQFPLGESKCRHPAGCSVLDYVSNLTFGAASQATAVDECRSPVASFSTLTMATLAALFELFFSLAEIRTLSPRPRNLTKGLDRC